MAEEVLYTMDDRGVATLTLNQPKTLNAFDAAQIAAFNDAMKRAVDSRGLRIIVIAGTGPVFCSGADMKYLQRAGKLSAGENLADARDYAAMGELLRAAPVPVVGRVQGGAYGGGLGLAVACDIVLTTESARFAITEARYGLTPSLMVPFLIGRIGQRGCRRWCLTGEILPAAKARDIGLADIVVADDALDRELAELIDRLLMNAPGGLAQSKASIGENARPPLTREIHDRALAAFAEGRGSPQQRKGRRRFSRSGRRPGSGRANSRGRFPLSASGRVFADGLSSRPHQSRDRGSRQCISCCHGGGRFRRRRRILFHFSGGSFFAISFANFLAVYACIFIFIVTTNFSIVRPWAMQIGFLLPIIAFQGTALLQRERLRYIVQARRLRDERHLGRTFIWLIPVSVIGAATFWVPGRIVDPDTVDAVFLAAMGIISIIVVVTGKDVATFLLDSGLLFEEFFQSAARLLVPAFAFLTFYSMLVIVFACIYRILDRFTTDPQFTINSAPETISFADALYFSIITMSTVGYGDVLPITDSVHVIVAIQIILGVLLLLFGFSEIIAYSREKLRDRTRDGGGD